MLENIDRGVAAGKAIGMLGYTVPLNGRPVKDAE